MGGSTSLARAFPGRFGYISLTRGRVDGEAFPSLESGPKCFETYQRSGLSLPSRCACPPTHAATHAHLVEADVFGHDLEVVPGARGQEAALELCDDERHEAHQLQRLAREPRQHHEVHEEAALCFASCDAL